MDSALASHLGDPGLIPGWGNIEISSKFPPILFISVEILVMAEISKLAYAIAYCVCTQSFV